MNGKEIQRRRRETRKISKLESRRSERFLSPLTSFHRRFRIKLNQFILVFFRGDKIVTGSHGSETPRNPDS